MTTACIGCGTAWTGKKLEHCTVCHRTFTSTRAGDMHEVGHYAPKPGQEGRRCRTDLEMAEAGLVSRELVNGVTVWGRAGTSPRF